MKFTNNNELNIYLDELIDKHQLNLSISDLLGSIFSNSEITNKKEIELLASKFNTSTHEVFLSKISDYLDIDLSIEDNEEIFDSLIANSIHELDLSKYTNNPYYQLVKTSPIKNKDYELIWDHYYPYELFAYQDMSNKDYLEINSLGYFKNEFPFLALTHRGVTWMNITPNEIETMESAINQITGTAIVFGLGLGYLPFMISNKSDVKKVIVIENDKNIIKLFKDNLLDYFPHKNKIEIKEDDANNYLNKDLKMDYAFVDLWHSPEDGLEFYLKFKKSERYCKSTTFLYWLESSFYLYLRRLMMTLIEELRSNEPVNYQQESSFEDHIINTYYKKTKSLVISNKAQLDNLLSDQTLLNLLLDD